MLCGYPPFYSKHHSRTIPKDMRKKIMTASFDFPEDEWSQISEMAKDIVRKYVTTHMRTHTQTDLYSYICAKITNVDTVSLSLAGF